MAVQYHNQINLETSFKHQDAGSFIMVSLHVFLLHKSDAFHTLTYDLFDSMCKAWFASILFNLILIYSNNLIKILSFPIFKGFSDFLPKLVDQMAAASLEQEAKDPEITYSVIREEDTEQVLKLLKSTFFKVK